MAATASGFILARAGHRGPPGRWTSTARPTAPVDVRRHPDHAGRLRRQPSQRQPSQRRPGQRRAGRRRDQRAGRSGAGRLHVRDDASWRQTPPLGAAAAQQRLRRGRRPGRRRRHRRYGRTDPASTERQPPADAHRRGRCGRVGRPVDLAAIPGARTRSGRSTTSRRGSASRACWSRWAAPTAIPPPGPRRTAAVPGPGRAARPRRYWHRPGIQQLTSVTYGTDGWLAVGGASAGAPVHPVVLTSGNGGIWAAADGEAAFSPPGLVTEQAAAGPQRAMSSSATRSVAGRTVAAAWWSTGLTGWQRAATRSRPPGDPARWTGRGPAGRCGRSPRPRMGSSRSAPTATPGRLGLRGRRPDLDPAERPAARRRGPGRAHPGGEQRRRRGRGRLRAHHRRPAAPVRRQLVRRRRHLDRGRSAGARGPGVCHRADRGGGGFWATGTFGNTPGHQDVVVWSSPSGSAWTAAVTPAGPGLTGPGHPGHHRPHRVRAHDHRRRLHRHPGRRATRLLAVTGPLRPPASGPAATDRRASAAGRGPRPRAEHVLPAVGQARQLARTVSTSPGRPRPPPPPAPAPGRAGPRRAGRPACSGPTPVGGPGRRRVGVGHLPGGGDPDGVLDRAGPHQRDPVLLLEQPRRPRRRGTTISDAPADRQRPGQLGEPHVVADLQPDAAPPRARHDHRVGPRRDQLGLALPERVEQVQLPVRRDQLARPRRTPPRCCTPGRPGAGSNTPATSATPAVAAAAASPAQNGPSSGSAAARRSRPNRTCVASGNTASVGAARSAARPAPPAPARG